MSPLPAEIVGTALLLLLGDGVVANVILKRTKGAESGWMVISMGWGMAVFVAVFVVGRFSGAHINPAVTLGMAAAGKLRLGRRTRLCCSADDRCGHRRRARVAPVP